VEVGIKQAKNDLSRLVAAAQEGQQVFLLNHGKRVAEIVAVRSHKERKSPLPGYGMFKDDLHLPPGWDSQEARERDEKEVLAVIEGLK
jgi:prevent-host-death family protein